MKKIPLNLLLCEGMECDHLQCAFGHCMVGNSLDSVSCGDQHCYEPVQPIHLRLQVAIQCRPTDSTSFLSRGSSCRTLVLVHQANPTAPSHPVVEKEVGLLKSNVEHDKKNDEERKIQRKFDKIEQS